MERKPVAALVVSCMILLFSCEAVYTTSLLEWAQRDPSNLSTAGKIAYAEDALAAGDRDALKKAYDALKDTSDPDLMPFVAELALGAAGVTEALADMLGKVAAGTSEAEIKTALEDALAAFSAGDLDLIAEAAALIDAAVIGGADITAAQYFTAGVGMLVVALDEEVSRPGGGDVYSIDTTTPDSPGEKALDFLFAARDLFTVDSEAYALLDDFSGYF